MGIISNGNTVIDNGAIDANEVDTTQIANDAVTADKLADTAVSAGEYTVATVTVDAQGRITAASSGSAGGGNMLIETITNSSGNYTSPANVNTAQVYLAGGSGGCAGRNSSRGGGTSGAGGYGLFGVSIDPSTTYPFTIGSGGNGGNSAFNSSNPGNPGSASNFGNLATANAGNGSPSAPVNTNAPGGNPGSAPGADFDLLNRRDFLAVEAGGAGATHPGGPAETGPAGNPGSLMLFTNKLS